MTTNASQLCFQHLHPSTLTSGAKADKLFPALASELTATLLLLVAVAVILLFMALLFRPARQLWCSWRLHSSGPADLSAQLLEASPNKVVTMQCLHWGKITFVGRYTRILLPQDKQQGFLLRHCRLQVGPCCSECAAQASLKSAVRRATENV